MSWRLEKINELLSREISQILLKEMDFDNDVFLTVQEVQASKDLNHAKIKISVFPKEKSKEVLSLIEKNIWRLQHILNKRLPMKPVPKIKFVL